VTFIHSVASLFNLRLPGWMSFINPECSFELAYFEKFILMMISPVLLVIAMGLFVQARALAARLAVNTLRWYAPSAVDVDACAPGQVDMDPVSNPIDNTISVPESGPEPEPAEIEYLDGRTADSLDDLQEQESGSAVATDAPKQRCVALKRFCRDLASPGGPRRILIRTLESLAVFDRAAMTMQMVSIFLVYLMVGYVAIVSAALEPLGCADVYGSRVMTHQTTIEWCVHVVLAVGCMLLDSAVYLHMTGVSHAKPHVLQ
jgi:hypothetical protein